MGIFNRSPARKPMTKPRLLWDAAEEKLIFFGILLEKYISNSVKDFIVHERNSSVL